MGFKIGAPSLKLNNVGRTSKSCGDFGAVAREALEERAGRDPDINKDKADLNRYTGYRTAQELQEYSKKHMDGLKDASGRKLRKDAVAMCATVLKPPAVMMNAMTHSDQVRFLDDCFDIFAEIVGRDNVKSRADHFDEVGSHTHVFWEPMTQDGRLCAKEVHNLQFFGRVNRELPQRLRALGWDIEDCEMYDAAKENYEQEKKKSGRSSVAYKAEAEAKKNELMQEIQKAEDALNAVAEPVGTLEKAQEIEARADHKTTTFRRIETVTLPREDYEELLRGYRHSAVVDLQNDTLLDDLNLKDDKYGKLLERLNLIIREKQLQDARMKVLTRELDEIKSWWDLAKAFFRAFNLFARFEEWCEKQKELQRIDRKIDRLHRQWDDLDR